ncbi:WYL domain-containing protein [Myxococcus sp. K15C18031901]|uniref:helix-turn-helix transcriptional regulator n=1 Tax=Myxococcus dinghuensis TaxID=2906761 RepID=UPI0020A83495|nr:WYL domain-containing protein [Myxococcus dinghuensis]MCP3097730.1 WYL domain-containing protein [Myxococcus dinghuensis]
MRADRLVSLMLLLQTRPRMTAGDLARELQVSERTIHRDLDALSRSGVPVYTTRGAAGGVALVEGWRTQLTGLTRAELHALAAISGAPGGLGALGLSAPLRSGLVKLSAALPALQQPALEYARQRLHVDAASFFAQEEDVPHLGVLRDATWQNRRVSLGYRDFDGKAGRRVVEPYALVLKAERWYLVAGTDKGPRVYRGSRIEAVRLRRETFERPARFDLLAFWRDWCARFAGQRPRYDVTLRLTAQAEATLRRMRPPTDTARFDAGRRERDGRRTATVDFERESIALAQVLEAGPGVEVVEPESLRARLVDLARAVLDTHGRDASHATRPRHSSMKL